MGMIRIQVAEPGSEWDSTSPFIRALEAWKEWASFLGLQHCCNSSEITELQPGQWCVKSYDRTRSPPRFPGRQVCFHESDRAKAMLFKLTWG